MTYLLVNVIFYQNPDYNDNLSKLNFNWSFVLNKTDFAPQHYPTPHTQELIVM